MATVRAWVAALSLAGAALIFGSERVASATPVGNDDIGTATIVADLPYTASQDTTEATTSTVESDIQSSCAARQILNGVWYRFTAATDTELWIDASSSDYPVGVFAATGLPGSFDVRGCVSGTARVSVRAGETVHLMLFGWWGRTSGNLSVTIRRFPRPPSIAFTVDPIGLVGRDGVATITGTVTVGCSYAAEQALTIQLRRSGR